MSFRSSFIDRCVKELERHNLPAAQYRQRLTNRSQVSIIPAAWSSHERCVIRAESGHWEGKRYISDTTSPIHVLMYGHRRVTVDPKARTIQMMTGTHWWGSTEARILNTIGGPYCSYILATHVDRGAWGVSCDNGWFHLTPQTLLHDTKDGLICDNDRLRLMKSEVTHESTVYVRQVARRLRDLFYNMDMLRRGSDAENGAYGSKTLQTMFDMSERERDATIVEWWNSGGEYDDYIYQCFLTQCRLYWQYNYHGFSQHATRFFDSNIRRMANTIRRAKYSSPV